MMNFFSTWCRRWFPALCIAIVAPLSAFGALPDTTTRSPLLLGVFLSPVFGIAAPEFAQEYERISNTLFSFDSPLAFGATTKAVFDQFRIGVSAEAYRTRFQDNYQQDFAYPDGFGDTIRGFRGIYQDFHIKVLLVFATIEVVPIRAQFRTYAGVGLGMAYTDIYWSEAVASTDPTDRRKGGVHVNEQRFAPAFRLYSGIELGFDRVEGTSLLHSLFIEARYSSIPVSLPLLEGIATQMEGAPAGWNDRFSIQTGGFAIVAGLTLQFRK